MMPKGWAAAFVVLLCLSLGGCATKKSPRADLPSKESIQRGKKVSVKAGENVYALAQRNRVSMRELIVLNDLDAPYTLKPGQQLYLPYDGSMGEVAPPEAAPRGSVEKVELSPIMPAGVSAQSLEPLPPTSQKTSVQTYPIQTPPVQAASAQAAPAAKTTPDPLARPVSQAKEVTTTASESAESDSSDDVAEDVDVALKWPIQGTILSKFGSKAAGVANDGINIGAPKGSPVGAAAPGMVVYAGNDMKGFGNLVLVKHRGELVTAYAHLDRVLVKKDSVVAPGDMIGTVGKTGNVTTPQLHFEIRQSGKPVDPSEVIKGGM